MNFYGLTIHDSHPNTGDVTVKKAFTISSNVAFASLADKFYGANPAKFINHLHQFHLDSLTGIDITASSGMPEIKKASNKYFSATTIPYMAHGYEERVTPLNMLMLYNAVANNGKMMRPYLVSSIREYGVEVKSIQPYVLVDKICSDETLAQARECLKAVVDSAHGTAHKVLYDPQYSIAGKTGTAVSANNKNGYSKGAKTYQASFIGYFPADQPKYTMAVVIQNSRDSKLWYGADVAGSVFKEISDKIYGRYLSTKQYSPPEHKDSLVYNYMGLRNDWNSIFSALRLPFSDSAVAGYWRAMQMKNNSGILNTPPNSMSTSGSVTPNVVGMGLKDAVYLLENMGLKVTALGRGRVVNQSMMAGTNFKKSQIISLILN
jgi:cell division protein FtsI (penicillin-binding protein 3)